MNSRQTKKKKENFLLGQLAWVDVVAASRPLLPQATRAATPWTPGMVEELRFATVALQAQQELVLNSPHRQ